MKWDDPLIGRVIAVAFLCAASGCVSGPNTARNLSEADLLEYASKPYDKAEKMNTREFLGTFNGHAVVAEFPCADVCPDYTVRIIHFDLGKGENCANVGGVERAVRVPVAAAAARKSFCFPRVLVENGGAYLK